MYVLELCYHFSKPRPLNFLSHSQVEARSLLAVMVSQVYLKITISFLLLTNHKKRSKPNIHPVLYPSDIIHSSVPQMSIVVLKLLHFMKCSFNTMYMGTVVYFESIPHIWSSCCKLEHQKCINPQVKQSPTNALFTPV